MKMTTIRGIKKTALLLAFASAGSMSASALTFTALTSGNFSSSATWAGGITPSLTNTADVIVIPSGVTVNLDQNVIFNGSTSALTLNGAITSSTGKALILTSTTFSGSGTVNVDSMVLSTTSGFSFTGSITAQRLTSTGATVGSSASVTVSNTLRLMSGTLTMASGSLSVANNAMIVLSGGSLANTGGSLNLGNTYNVRYEGSNSLTSGLELSGSGLNNIEVATSSSSGVALSNDLTIRGTLTLSSGSFRLNGRNLTFTANGNFSASGSGSIVSSSPSSLTFSAANSFTGGVRFRADSNMINNLVVNMSNMNASARLGTSLNVAGTLTLQNGRLDIDTSLLALNGNSSTSVSGGSSASYVVTGSNGRLGLNISTGNTATYHIGTSNYYAPMTLTANTGNASGMLSVGVQDSVRAQGTIGNALSLTRKMVNTTWNVTSNASGNVNLNMTAMWSAAMEVNGFNRNQAYISHYTNGNWDAAASTSATLASNGMFSLSRNNITSLSPFAVMDKEALGVSNNNAANKDLNVYPNPAGNTLYFSSVYHFDRAAIYNTAGTLIKSETLSGNSISLQSLPAGSYFVHLTDGNTTAVKQITKL